MFYHIYRVCDLHSELHGRVGVCCHSVTNVQLFHIKYKNDLQKPDAQFSLSGLFDTN